VNFFSWKTVPFVRFLLPLILGIILGVFVGASSTIYFRLLILGMAGTILTLNTMHIKRRIFLEKWSLLFIASMLLGLGLLLVDLHTSLDDQEHFSRMQGAGLLRGVITESPQEKKKSTKAVLEIEHVLIDSVWVNAKGDLLLYLEKSEESTQLEIGDELSLEVNYKEVEPPANPGQFNYKRFLSFRDIYHQQYVKSGHWVKVDEHMSMQRSAERIRTYLLQRLDRIGMQRSEKAIASALLLGKKDDLDPELIQSYASAGAMHVLAVSGLHVGIIFFILRFLFQWMDRWKKGALFKAAILIACLWIYAFITGLSPSVVRAATMFSAVTLGTGLGRKSSIYNTVASSAFVLLVVNPFYIMEVGFQLSYLAVLGIIYLHPKIYSLLYFPSKVPDKIWEISCVSIAAQLATFPLGLLYFHQFPTYFLLSNLLVIPAAFLILYVGIGYLMLSWIPYIGVWIGKALHGLIWVLNKGVGSIESWPHSLIKGIDIGVFMSWALYMVLGLYLLAFIYQKRKLVLYATAGLSGILLWQVYELWSFKQHPYLVVYDVRGDSVINILHAGENLIYSDENWADDMSKQQFHLRNNWNKHAAPEPVFVKQESHPSIRWVDDVFMIYRDRTLVILDKKWPYGAMDEKLPVDFLIVSYHKGLNLNSVFETIAPDQIILDGTVRGKTIQRLKKEIRDIPVHVINEDGYFRRRL
jgi:competence protein ComEC